MAEDAADGGAERFPLFNPLLIVDRFCQRATLSLRAPARIGLIYARGGSRSPKP